MKTVSAVPPASDLEIEYASVVRRIARDHRVRRSTAARWLHEAMKFLDVAASSAAPVAPSKRADRAWHAFILHTRDYERWCMARYGRFVHHDPSEEPDPDAYVRALRLMHERFGPLDRRIWPAPAGGHVDASLLEIHAGGGASCGGGGCGGAG